MPDRNRHRNRSGRSKRQLSAPLFRMKISRRSQKVKPVVALRVSPETLEKAKATGKGYTGFLSRLLDNAINDPQIVAKSM